MPKKLEKKTKETKPVKPAKIHRENKAPKTKNPIRLFGRAIKTTGHYVIPGFLRRSWDELMMVTWPNWKLSRQLTVAVVIFALIFAVLLAVLDWGLSKIFKELFLK